VGSTLGDQLPALVATTGGHGDSRRRQPCL